MGEKWRTLPDGRKISVDEFVYGEGSMANPQQIAQSEKMREDELVNFADISEEDYKKLDKSLLESERLGEQGHTQLEKIMNSNDPVRIKLERMKLLRKSPFYKKLSDDEKETFDLATQSLQGFVDEGLKNMKVDSSEKQEAKKTKSGENYDGGIWARLGIREGGGGY